MWPVLHPSFVSVVRFAVILFDFDKCGKHSSYFSHLLFVALRHLNSINKVCISFVSNAAHNSLSCSCDWCFSHVALVVIVVCVVWLIHSSKHHNAIYGYVRVCGRSSAWGANHYALTNGKQQQCNKSIRTRKPKRNKNQYKYMYYIALHPSWLWGNFLFRRYRHNQCTLLTCASSIVSHQSCSSNVPPLLSNASIHVIHKYMIWWIACALANGGFNEFSNKCASSTTTRSPKNSFAQTNRTKKKKTKQQESHANAGWRKACNKIYVFNPIWQAYRMQNMIRVERNTHTSHLRTHIISVRYVRA